MERPRHVPQYQEDSEPFSPRQRHQRGMHQPLSKALPLDSELYGWPDVPQATMSLDRASRRRSNVPRHDAESLGSTISSFSISPRSSSYPRSPYVQRDSEHELASSPAHDWSSIRPHSSTTARVSQDTNPVFSSLRSVASNSTLASSSTSSVRSTLSLGASAMSSLSSGSPLLISDFDAKTLLNARLRSHSLIDEHHATRQGTVKSEPVATWKGARIYEFEPQRFQDVNQKQLRVPEKRLNMKRYVAHFQMSAAIEEVTALLMPSDPTETGEASPITSDITSQVRKELCPEIVQNSILWRPSIAAEAATLPDRAGRRVSWTAIQWVVQEMPTLLTQKRDFLLLERHHTFVTKTQKRGYVQLQHSTEAPHFDPSVSHSSRRVTRGTIHQSGVVAVESETVPGLLHVSIAMEVDFFGTYSPVHHRHLVIKRLSKWADLRDLIWKSRMAKSGRLVLIDSLRRLKALTTGVVPGSGTCGVCPLRTAARSFTATASSNKPKQPNVGCCQCCQRQLCLECSRKCDFPAFLVDQAFTRAIAHQHPESSSTIAALSASALKRAKANWESVSALVCKICIAGYASPHPCASAVGG